MKTMLWVMVLMVALTGCSEEGDGGGGGMCAMPEGPPPAEGADFCQWGPMCGNCAVGEETAYFEPDESGCAWVELWRHDSLSQAREQLEREAACQEAQGGFDFIEDYREAP
jgi:hypothetical protein